MKTNGGLCCISDFLPSRFGFERLNLKFRTWNFEFQFRSFKFEGRRARDRSSDVERRTDVTTGQVGVLTKREKRGCGCDSDTGMRQRRQEQVLTRAGCERSRQVKARSRGQLG
eukprot:1880894-Pleurochrysis_carterae.AAC.1